MFLLCCAGLPWQAANSRATCLQRADDPRTRWKAGSTRGMCNNVISVDDICQQRSRSLQANDCPTSGVHGPAVPSSGRGSLAACRTISIPAAATPVTAIDKSLAADERERRE